MDVEKTIQFLLENQARFDARFARFEATFETGMAETKGRLDQLTGIQERQGQMMGQLVDVVASLARLHEEETRRAQQAEQVLREAEQVLRDDVQRVSGNVDALVRIVDEWIRRNGGRPPAT